MLRRAVSVLGAAACLAAAPTPATAEAACRGAGSMPSEIGTQRAAAAVRCLLRAERRAHDVRSVRAARSLRRAASRHADAMLRRGVIAHRVRGEASLKRRVRRAGYRRSHAAEVIGYGSSRASTPRAIVAGWMSSPSHRAAVLGSRARHIGVAVRRRVPGMRGRAATYVAVLGG